MKPRSALLISVLASLGDLTFKERYIKDKKIFVEGEYNSGGVVYVNPIPHVVDTVIHEILHHLHPEWPEPYVSNRTTWLMRQMTDEEIQEVYRQYTQRASGRE